MNDSKYKSDKCFNCGERGHQTKTCPEAAKGLKCFRCNLFGHKGIDCPDNKKNAKSVNVIRKNNMVKEIAIDNVKLNALIDTGAELS